MGMETFNKKGFTLIELLIVIAVVGVVAAIIIIAIDPVKHVDRAKLAKAKSFYSQIVHRNDFYSVGTFNFDDGTGKDISGYGNDVTFSGTTNPSDCNLGLGGCKSFNGGSTSYGFRSAMSGLSRSQLTFMFWGKQNATNPTMFMHPIGIFGGHRATIYVSPNNYNYAYKFADINGEGYDEFIGTLDNRWHHFAVSFDGTKIKVYIDGELKVSRTANGTINNGDESLIIAATGTSSGPTDNYFNGYIDEVNIYSYAISQTKIQKKYAEGLLKKSLAMNN